jgi:glycosyltransferase involved in cell wall biosynthesis
LRILFVAHNFLPNHTGGTEVYTLQLGQHFQRMGHVVSVFSAEKDIGLPDLTLRRRDYGGLEVDELINNLYFEEFADTWTHPAVDRLFDRVLEERKPDVVHFQHLLYLSVGCVEQVRRRRIPVIFTLHDYWLQCPRYGQRVHADGSICHTIDFGRCAQCLARFRYRQTPVEQVAGAAIAALRQRTGLNLAPAARALQQSALRSGAHEGKFDEGRLNPAQVELRHQELLARDQALRQRLVPNVHRFLSPSLFLRDRFIEWGIPAEQILFLRTGVDLEAFGAVRRVPSERVRVGFIGTLIPAKGPHVLLSAWGLLPEDLRKRAELTIYGPSRHYPEYLGELQRTARQVGASLGGALSREEVPRALGEIDLLVVPSLWYENSPLVIVEAITTRTPLLVSNLGALMELVRPGVTGLHFRAGDVHDLAAQLERLLRNPAELTRLSSHQEPIKSVQQDVQQLEEIYYQAIDVVRLERRP